MRTRASEARRREPVRAGRTTRTTEEAKDGDDNSDYSSDSDIEGLVRFAVDRMKEARTKEAETTSAVKDEGWVQDFLPLDELREEDLTLRGSLSRKLKDVSILRKADATKEERIPKGLDSGFDLSLEEDADHDRVENLQQLLAKSSQDKLLEKSILKPDLEKQHSIPPYSTSRNSRLKERKKIRESKAGEGWYDMKAVEMTPELQNDLRALQMRSVLDPKRFYRKNDMKTLPKFVQVGTVMDNAVDFYHARVTKKERRQTIVDELLADAELRRHNKKKYMALQINRSYTKRKRRMIKHLK